MLPADPLLRDGVVVRLVGEAELVLRVVVLGQVGQDGGALEDGEVVPVVVDDGGDAAVGVDPGEPFLLLRALGDVDGLVGDPGGLVPVGLPELLEEDADLVAVGGAQREELDALRGNGSGGLGPFGHVDLVASWGFTAAAVQMMHGYECLTRTRSLS